MFAFTLVMANDPCFSFFFISVSAGYLFAPLKSSKLDQTTDSWPSSPAVIRRRSEQIWYLSHLDIEGAPCRSPGDEHRRIPLRRRAGGPPPKRTCARSWPSALNTRLALTLENEQWRWVLRRRHWWVSFFLEHSNGLFLHVTFIFL